MESRIQKMFSIPEDINDQLIHLCDRCPMMGDITIITKRTPIFKTFYDLLDKNSFLILEQNDNEVIGCVGSVHRKTRYQGQVMDVAYWGDLKVIPEYRKSLSAYRLMKEMVKSEVQSGTRVAVASIIDGNEDSMIFTHGRAGLPKGYLAGRFILYNVFPLSKLKTEAGFDIMEAEKSDIPELVSLYNHQYQDHDFAPVLTEAELTNMVETFPGFSIDKILVAKRNNRIEAMLVCWDQYELQKFVIKEYNTSAQVMSLFIRLLSLFVKMPHIPGKNKELKFVYVCFLAHRNTTALKALIRTTHNKVREDGYTYFTVCLNQNDKTSNSLKGMIYNYIRSSLYAYYLDENIDFLTRTDLVHTEYSMLI
jgi:hypothetical protein